MLVYPKPGLRVRDPATKRFVPDDGLEVSPLSVLWARLIRDGDVTTERPLAAGPAPAKAAQPPAAQSEKEAG